MQATVGGGSADLKFSHHLPDRDVAVAADEADQLLEAACVPRGRRMSGDARGHAPTGRSVETFRSL